MKCYGCKREGKYQCIDCGAWCCQWHNVPREFIMVVRLPLTKTGDTVKTVGESKVVRTKVSKVWCKHCRTFRRL